MVQIFGIMIDEKVIGCIAAIVITLILAYIMKEERRDYE